MKHVEIPLTNSKLKCLVSAEDAERVRKKKWRLNKNGYAYTITVERMHRFILSPPDDMLVDHANHDRLDNRRENLRICTSQENNRNRRKVPRAKPSQHASPFKGVARIANSGYKFAIFRAGLFIREKMIHLGCYQSEEAAARAYDSAAIFLFGEFARTNFPREQTTPMAPEVIRKAAEEANKLAKADRSEGVKLCCKRYTKRPWSAHVRYGQRTIYFGHYATKDDALQARRCALDKIRNGELENVHQSEITKVLRGPMYKGRHG